MESKQKSLDKHSHRWGFHDTNFICDENQHVQLTGDRYNLCGYPLTQAIPFVNEVLETTLDPFNIQQEKEVKPIEAPKTNEEFFVELKANFSENQYSQEEESRLIHSHGQTSVDEVFRVLFDSLVRFVDLVFYPESEEDVEKLVHLATKFDVCLIPYGGGTSVSSALLCPENEARMIVSVDMGQMSKLLWVDEKNLTASAQAGITGIDLEKALEAKGFVMGHEPDSLEVSTLGGWISTNASGMKKNKYGNIEDIVLDLTLITPKGKIESHQITPRKSVGVQPNFMAFGSEGNFGIITKAIFKIHPKPEIKEYGSIVFPQFSKGLDFLYELRQVMIPPASIRLVDNRQFRLSHTLKPPTPFFKGILDSFKKFFLLNILGFKPENIAACTIVFEGTKREVKAQKKQLFKLAKKHGGFNGGSENGERGYMLTFGIAYMRDWLNKLFVIAETMETSVPWSKVLDVCKAIEETALELQKKHNIPGIPFVSSRITQTYHTGVCIYTIYAFNHKGLENPIEIFKENEHALREAIMKSGGSLSHHHGIGKLRKSFMPQVFTETGLESIKEMKQNLDPKNTFGVGNGIHGHRPHE